MSVVLFVISIILLAPTIKDQLNSWALLPRPEKLTELYFTKPNNLPSTYTPGKAQNIGFTVHNIEYQAISYKYEVVEESQDGKQVKVLTQSSFTLKQNQFKSVSFTSPLSNMGERAKLIIELPTVNESIDYLVTRSAQ